MPTPDEWAEADMTTEEVLGRPSPHTYAAGIAAMEQRLDYLRRRRTALTANAPDDADSLAKLNQEIQSAELRLAEYRRNYGARN